MLLFKTRLRSKARILSAALLISCKCKVLSKTIMPSSKVSSTISSFIFSSRKPAIDCPSLDAISLSAKPNRPISFAPKSFTL